MLITDRLNRLINVKRNVHTKFMLSLDNLDVLTVEDRIQFFYSLVSYEDKLILRTIDADIGGEGIMSFMSESV